MQILQEHRALSTSIGWNWPAEMILQVRSTNVYREMMEDKQESLLKWPCIIHVIIFGESFRKKKKGLIPINEA